MEIRLIRDDEVPAFRDAMLTTFGAQLDDDPTGDERMRALVEPTRRWAAFDGEQIVGTAATFTQTLAIPGGTLPMAGLTMVTVRPTHRRRGVLRGFIDTHLADARTRGEIISGLWASEASIYGRFGYGIAAHALELRVRADAVQLVAPADPSVEIQLTTEAVARDLLPAVHARAAATRPGLIGRTAAWWNYRVLLDRSVDRGSSSTRRFLVARRAGIAVGYAVLRQQLTFTADSLPGGKVVIQELLADDGAAEHALWACLLRFDLHPHVEWWNAPLDEALPWRLTDPRQVARKQVDTLWLRIDDVAAALTARSYAGTGTVQLQVDDDTPLELRVDDDGVATVSAVPAGAGESRLHLSRAALASCYLGGTAPSTLARAGLVRGDVQAIATLDRMVATPRPPWCLEVF